jgi:hypothetical protein
MMGNSVEFGEKTGNFFYEFTCVVLRVEFKWVETPEIVQQLSEVRLESAENHIDSELCILGIAESIDDLRNVEEGDGPALPTNDFRARA